MAIKASCQPSLSLIHGSTSTPLWHKTIGAILHERAHNQGDEKAIIVPWQNIKCTFKDLQVRSGKLAKALLSSGVRHGDSVAIMAGNRVEYIDLFLAAARIGCAVVVLNNTYTAKELVAALTRTRPKIICIAQNIGSRSLLSCIEELKNSFAAGVLKSLVHAIVLASKGGETLAKPFISYENFLSLERSAHAEELEAAERLVKDDDIVNVQFTSGTTGSPKAAMLTHRSMANNGRLVGTRMHLTNKDVVCCPPPLFHCFGLVMGFLASLTNGSSIVFPADQFDASRTYDAVVSERCTAVLGVPTMFTAILGVAPQKRLKITTVRVGLAAGSMVPAPLLNRLDTELGIDKVLIAYGMTETSPVTFMMDFDDTQERSKKGLGTVMPHTSAKVVDAQGHLLPVGSRGELCTSGYALMRGYLANETGTNEVMRRDENGVLWMHTGDECVIDERGYCHITGRIKDLIIRGGENIFPAEIEEHLLLHPSICEASVVGLPDEKYGEAVSCFLRVPDGTEKTSDAAIQAWVGENLGRHKIPAWVFWIGEGDDCVARDYPKTGSGKHQKHLLKDLGVQVLKLGNPRKLRSDRARL